MAISLVGAESATAESGVSDIAVPRPAGYASGDVALAVACVDDDDPVGLPTGFSSIHDEAFGGTDSRLKVGYKVMGASEPTFYDFTKDSIEEGVAAIAVFRGVNNTSVVDAPPSYNTGDSTTPTCPATTTTTPNAAVIALYGHESGAGTASAVPGGTTLVVTDGISSTIGGALGVAWKLQASVGSSGDLEFTAGNDDTWGAISFSLMDENESPPPKTADGSMTAARAGVDGAGKAFSILTGSGVLDAARAGVGGTGDNFTGISVSAALAAQTAVLSGSADRLVFAGGSLAAQSASVAGAGYRTVLTSASFAAAQAVLTVTALRVVTGDAALGAPSSDMDGDALRIGDSQGQMEASPAMVSAGTQFARNALGAMAAGGATTTSTSEITWRVGAALVAEPALLGATVQVFRGHTASGSLQARPSAVSAATQRGVSGGVALQATPAVVYTVSWLRQDSTAGVWQDLKGGQWVAKS